MGVPPPMRRETARLIIQVWQLSTLFWIYCTCPSVLITRSHWSCSSCWQVAMQWWRILMVTRDDVDTISYRVHGLLVKRLVVARWNTGNLVPRVNGLFSQPKETVGSGYEIGTLGEWNFEYQISGIPVTNAPILVTRTANQKIRYLFHSSRVTWRWPRRPLTLGTRLMSTLLFSDWLRRNWNFSDTTRIYRKWKNETGSSGWNI